MRLVRSIFLTIFLFVMLLTHGLSILVFLNSVVMGGQVVMMAATDAYIVFGLSVASLLVWLFVAVAVWRR